MPATTTAQTLADLLDRAAISDTIFKYATGIDRRDWPLYRSIFTDEVEFDFTSWRGVRETMRADDWIVSVRQTLACFDATQHNMTNPVITLAGDEATIVVHMVAMHHFEGEMQQLGGFYTNRLRRDASGWKISACCLTITWEQGERALFERAAARGPRPRVDVGAQGI
ncbi:nuclear transport factor 2 family protein [Hydrocarboniphaga sp.]|uniref:nuclear transport factor 2 family protein n=1 Tax=Hydrocarboniphaga sp. TaxID=2033016 RepID=UPI003D140DE4